MNPARMLPDESCPAMIPEKTPRMMDIRNMSSTFPDISMFVFSFSNDEMKETFSWYAV